MNTFKFTTEVVIKSLEDRFVNMKKLLQQLAGTMTQQLNFSTTLQQQNALQMIHQSFSVASTSMSLAS